MKNAASVIKTTVFKPTVCCIFFMLVSALAHAQTRGRVEVIKDSRIDTLIAKRSGFKSGSSKGGAISSRGYRVQFFMGSSRKEAFDAQARFQEMYPEIRTYILYREPNFKVKAGDFRSRLEASKLMHEIRPIFPALFIIPEKINPPKLDTSND
jgi:hypothetical protein